MPIGKRAVSACPTERKDRVVQCEAHSCVRKPRKKHLQERIHGIRPRYTLLAPWCFAFLRQFHHVLYEKDP
ncbi:hypothetical protein NC651_004665 [Populus alba x Populus x berolinensis]|nr:hypothetical protein NC651_004665 [Populus alba x Populus x berolinensis]